MQVKALATALAATAAAAAVGAGAAGADMMHPVLGAKLAGMGEHGVVNFKSMPSKLCWTFELGTKGVTSASIRDRHGMTVVRLGSQYSPKSCTAVKAAVLGAIDRKPSSYVVWVDTKGHPGDLRGMLHAGMADMKGM